VVLRTVSNPVSLRATASSTRLSSKLIIFCNWFVGASARAIRRSFARSDATALLNSSLDLKNASLTEPASLICKISLSQRRDDMSLRRLVSARLTAPITPRPVKTMTKPGNNRVPVPMFLIPSSCPLTHGIRSMFYHGAPQVFKRYMSVKFYKNGRMLFLYFYFSEGLNLSH
jgi:hypothetical protein